MPAATGENNNDRRVVLGRDPLQGLKINITNMNFKMKTKKSNSKDKEIGSGSNRAHSMLVNISLYILLGALIYFIFNIAKVECHYRAKQHIAKNSWST